MGRRRNRGIDSNPFKNLTNAISIAKGQGDYQISKSAATTIARKAAKEAVDKVDAERIGAKAGEAGGRWLGDRVGLGGVGAHIGKLFGGLTGKGIKALFGRGDYRVTKNDLAPSFMIDQQGFERVPRGMQAPDFRPKSHGNVQVEHREFVCNIVVPDTPGDFTLLEFDVGAGNRDLHPVLSAFATVYQQYCYDGLMFMYRPMVAPTSDAGGGTIIIAAEYDVLAEAPVNKVQLENSEYAVSCRPADGMIHTVECAPGQVANNLYYISEDDTRGDIRLNYLCKLYVATQGLAGTLTPGDVLGELWCVSLTTFVKTKYPNLALDSARVNATTGVDRTTAFFGSDPVVEGTSIDVDGNELSFRRAGDYLLALRIVGTGLNSSAVGISASTVQDYSTEVSDEESTTSAVRVYRIRVSAGGQSMTFNGSGTSTLTSTNAWVASFNYDYDGIA